MSRYFMIQSWVGSHENEPDYNGQQCGERNVRSIEAVPLYDQFGNANVSAFSDEAIAARSVPTKKKTLVPLKQRILPQASRVEKLRSEAIELEAAFKAGEFTPEEYTLLRDVAFRKLHRAEELLKKAITPDRPTLHEDDEYADEMPEVEVVYEVNSSVSPTIHTSTWIDDLPASNSLKLPLQKTLQVVRMLVRLSHKAGSYWQELKEV